MHAQLAQLGLQITELLLQVLLVLGPERTGLDFSGRLSRCMLASYRIFMPEHQNGILTIVNECREAVVEMVVIV